MDSIHMTAGIMTELIEINNLDPHTNYEEKLTDEGGDCLWYISNYCNLHNINPEFKSEVDGKGSLQWAGKLLDYDKKKLAYGKNYDRDRQIEAVNGLVNNLLFKITMYQLSPEDVMEKNIKKLRVRFPDKFQADLAINKDESKESEVFK
jgi:NTP pyrophosphatase (non-canonical NTP hydrolase)